MDPVPWTVDHGPGLLIGFGNQFHISDWGVGADNGARLFRVGPWLWDWRMSVCVLVSDTSLQTMFATGDSRRQAVTDIKSRNGNIAKAARQIARD